MGIVISLYFLLIILSIYSGENNAVQRMFELDILLNRKFQYIYAIETFLQEPLFGHGLKNYAYIDYSLIQFNDVKIDFGAHNGYLSILVQYGIVFSSIFFSIFFYYLYKIYRSQVSFFGENNSEIRFLFFVVTYTLVNGLFENTIIGISFFQTNLFWLTIAYFTYILHKKNESNSISY